MVDKKRILVVDDHVLIRSLVKKELEALGFHVDVTTDGKLALTRLKTGNYDLMITDLNMPELDGINLVGIVRGSDESYKDIPILCMTGEEPADLKKQAAQAGATGWIEKPFNPNTWGPTLNKILGA